MAEYLSPGVYVEEFDSGSVPMQGVSTSTAGFIGLAEKGPVQGRPVLITSVAEFRRKFGGYLSENEFGNYRYLAYAVDQFFANGGSRCYVGRVVPHGSKEATNIIDAEERQILKIKAKNPGIWGNHISIIIAPSTKVKNQAVEMIEESDGNKKYRLKNGRDFQKGDIIVFNDGVSKVYNKVTKVDGNVVEFQEPFEQNVVDTNLLPQKIISLCSINIEIKYDDIVENFDFVTLNVESSDFITKKLAKSELVDIEVTVGDEVVSPFQSISNQEEGIYRISLNEGSNGLTNKIDSGVFIGEDKGPGKRTGIQAFVDNTEVSIIAVPGVTDPNVQMSLVAHCENSGSRFAVLDIPRDKTTVNDVLTHRDMFDTDYAAMYHPWIEVFDPLDKKNTFIPPSGSVVGIYARTDQGRGVHKAPANEVVNTCVGLDFEYTAGEQDVLNPKGVNLIRRFVGQGIRVWGARTATSNPMWRYINVRRLFIYLEESIKVNTNWVVFEPNDELLWVRVKRTIEVFLNNVWRSGALAGSTASEAFFVEIGRSTMTKDDIDNGRLVCVIGVAPVKPAEFVVIRITQKTGE